MVTMVTLNYLIAFLSGFTFGVLAAYVMYLYINGK